MKTIEELRSEFDEMETAKKLIPFCRWEGGNYVNVWDDIDLDDPVNSMNFMFELFQELKK